MALDEAGNELAEAIRGNRDEYVENNRVFASETAARIDAAIAELRDALPRYGAESAAVEWIESFDVALACTGRAQQFTGGRCIVDTSRVTRESSALALPLLDLLAAITANQEPPRPRRHQLAAASR